jgi:TonB-dependent receptor
MRSLVLFTVLMCSFITAIAGGKIKGKVSDAKNGETIIGAVVMIKGTSNGTATDIDGNFVLEAAAGTHVLEVKYVGYQTKEVSDVKVEENKDVTVSITLTQASSTQLAEVTVQSSLKKENIGAIYVMQKNAATISDGISADLIKRSPDRSTGEVLKRVSGTTIQDNKFVIVRGLSDRYNCAIVDNAILPSTEPNRKAFSFDIIPANVIDNIIITKAATPDLPGDFAGGVISIHTKEIPDKNFNTVTIGTNYNTVSTFQPFKTGYKSPTDILGFDNGTRQLPSNMPTTDQILTNKLTKAQQIQAENSLNNDYSIKERKGLPAASLQASMGRVWDKKNNQHIGLIAAMTYGHTETVMKDVVRNYDNYRYKDNTYKYSTNLGGMVNLGYSAGKMKLVWKNLYNRNFDDNFLFREGNNFSSSKYINYYAFDLTQKSLLKSSLEGNLNVGRGQNKLNWVLAYNHITNNQPDQKKSTYFMDNGVMVADNSSIGKANNRLFSNLSENIYIANVNYTMPFELGKVKSSLKVGGMVQLRNRDFSARYLGFTPDNDPNNPNAASYVNSTLPIADLYSKNAISNGVYLLNDITSGSDKYTAQTTTGAAYAMIDNKFSERIRLVWGARLETFNLGLNTSLYGKALNIDTTWIDVLPSANFTYAVNEKSNLRASYYHTLARPELREIAPLSYFDYEMSALVNGNPKLMRTQIKNADLRYEVFPNNGEIMSASVFYKHFTNTIENEVYSSGISTFEIKPNNYPSAYNVGIEGDIRKTLAFIAPSTFMERMSFYANAAYIKSLVNDTTPNSKDRALTGQSNYVMNTSLSYTTEDGKVSFNALYNRIGQRIYLVGQGGGSTGFMLGNVFERPRNLLDLQVTYNISKRSEFRASVKDLLNAPYILYYDQNGNKKFDNPVFTEQVVSTEDYILQKYRPGTSVMFQYTYKF